MARFDVVIAAKDMASTLGTCCKALKEIGYLENLIIVVGKSKDSTEELAEKYGDIVVQDHGEGIGEARQVGLKNVRTSFFAFVDADVIVTSEWGRWCSETIEHPKVGACEGVAVPIGKYSAMTVEESKVKKGEYCTLGSTMLKTDVVKKVGMPKMVMSEDWELRRRIWAAGYKWIVNPNIKYPHLVTDWQGLKHRAGFSSRTRISPLKLIGVVSSSPLSLFSLKDYSFGFKIYNMMLIWADSYGYMKALKEVPSKRSVS